MFLATAYSSLFSSLQNILWTLWFPFKITNFFSKCMHAKFVIFQLLALIQVKWHKSWTFWDTFYLHNFAQSYSHLLINIYTWKENVPYTKFILFLFSNQFVPKNQLRVKKVNFSSDRVQAFSTKTLQTSFTGFVHRASSEPQMWNSSPYIFTRPGLTYNMSKRYIAINWLLGAGIR